MKNIHILPTTESVLGFRNNKYILRIGEPFTTYGNTNPHHMYITSDEKVTDGDWYLGILFSFNGQEEKPCQFNVGTKPCGEIPCGQKIVLTTDPMLVEAGVQKIGDSFLTWYVNNVRDFITIKHVLINPMGRHVDPLDLSQNHSGCTWKYLIELSAEPLSLADMKCSCIRYEAGCFTANCRSCGLPPKEKITVAPRPPYPLETDKQYTYVELRLWLYERDVYMYNYYTTYKDSGIPMITVDEYIESSHEYLMERKLKK